MALPLPWHLAGAVGLSQSAGFSRSAQLQLPAGLPAPSYLVNVTNSHEQEGHVSAFSLRTKSEELDTVQFIISHANQSLYQFDTYYVSANHKVHLAVKLNKLKLY